MEEQQQIEKPKRGRPKKVETAIVAMPEEETAVVEEEKPVVKTT